MWGSSNVLRLVLPISCQVLVRLESLLAVLVVVLVVQLEWPAIVSRWNLPRAGRQIPALFEAHGAGGQWRSIGYWVYLPDNYATDTDKSWPLVVFLHGSAERGDNLELVKHASGLPALIEDGQCLPMIVVSPQARSGEGWHAESLLALVDHAVEKFRVEIDRVYVTGFSMGAYGAWNLAAAAPGRFAAVVPIAGRGSFRDATRLKAMPVWAFHGADDEVVLLVHGQKMIDAVRMAGGNVQFTVLPERGHGIWKEVYRNPDLYRWLLKQRRSTKPTS